MVHGVGRLGKAQLGGTTHPPGLCHTSAVSGHQLVLLLQVGQLGAVWEVTELGITSLQ